jgi:hypothetical protein
VAETAIRRLPKAGEHVWLYGDRLLIRRITDRGRGPVVVTEDDAGWRIERPADRLAWDADTRAWR